MPIEELNELLASQIAAGEVVERPASAVKELTENSVDACAHQINVDIELGGSELIRVSDDGEGIEKIDLPLTIKRHATSKIQSFDDLMQVHTLGFRGEALASIASVSRLNLVSKHANADQAWRIRTEGTITHDLIPAAHPVGTTVEIRQLFYNTPGRRKFLKSSNTEFQHIQRILKQLALSYYDIGFKCTHQGKTAFNVKPATSQILREQRIGALLGGELLSELIYIQFEKGNLKLKGWISLPVFSRSQPNLQYLYINNRFVKDRIVTSSIKQAYRDVLYHDRHPVYILYLTIDPQEVDVNVHPAKSEVRFRQSQSIYQFFLRAVKEALEKVKPADIQARKDPFEIKETDSPTFSLDTPIIDTDQYLSSARPQRDHTTSNPVMFDASINRSPLSINDQAPVSVMVKEFPLGYAIAQLQGIYIIAQNKEGLILVDMHAAHERILYEKLKQQYGSQKLTRQNLLIPQHISILPDEYNAFKLYRSMLNDLGFECDAPSSDRVLIKTTPALLKNVNAEALIKDIINDLSHTKNTDRIDEQLNQILKSVSCHGACRAHDSLTISEMDALLRDIESVPRSHQCGHGRPTWIQLSMKDLDQFFLRGK